MKKLLHIIATPRGEESRTLKISKAFINSFSASHLDWRVEELNLFTEKIPQLTVKRVDGKYALLGGKDLTGETKEAWREIVICIEQFLSADGYLVSTPMWNFSIPYVLKHYIDVILQPKYLFRYTEKGPEGLVKNKKMIIITSRGGDYSKDSPVRNYDFQEPFLRTVFSFVGITDINFIIAQPVDALGPDVANEKIEEAINIAKKTSYVF